MACCWRWVCVVTTWGRTALWFPGAPEAPGVCVLATVVHGMDRGGSGTGQVRSGQVWFVVEHSRKPIPRVAWMIRSTPASRSLRRSRLIVEWTLDRSPT